MQSAATWGALGALFRPCTVTDRMTPHWRSRRTTVVGSACHRDRTDLSRYRARQLESPASYPHHRRHEHCTAHDRCISGQSTGLPVTPAHCSREFIFLTRGRIGDARLATLQRNGLCHYIGVIHAEFRQRHGAASAPSLGDTQDRSSAHQRPIDGPLGADPFPAFLSHHTDGTLMLG